MFIGKGSIKEWKGGSTYDKNLGKSGTTQNFMKLQTSAQSSSHNENFVNTSKK